MSSSDESVPSLSEDEEGLPFSPDPLPDPNDPKGKRPLRKRSLPSKLRGANIETSDLDMSRSATVQCSQTNKLHTLKLKDIYREDEEVLKVTKGAKILMNYKGKSYQAQFISFKVSEKRPSTIPPSAKKRKTDPDNILIQAKNDAKKKSKAKTTTNSDDTDDIVLVSPPNNTTVLDNEDKDLILNLARKVKKIEAMTAQILKIVQTEDSGTATLKEEIENGVPIMHLPSRDAYSFGLQLLDVMFTKEELASSLLYKSKKSDKPCLDEVRVVKMLKYMEKRYGNSWNVKTFTLKANQKCRDSRGCIDSTATSGNAEDAENNE